jgi:hypothetical protein
MRDQIFSTYQFGSVHNNHIILRNVGSSQFLLKY